MSFNDAASAAVADPGSSPGMSSSDQMALIQQMMDNDAANFNADMAERSRQNKLGTQLYTEFLWAKQERERYQDRLWNELYKMYRSQMPDERKSGEWRSKINVPTIWNAVEAAVPHMMEGIFANNQTFRLKSSASDDLIAAHEDLIQWELNEVVAIESVWEEHQRQKCLYGTSAVYTGFRTDYEKRGYWSIKQNPDPNAPKEMEVKQYDVAAYVGPVVEVIDIYTLYPHPRSTARVCPWLFRIQYFSKEKLISSKRFKNLDRLTESATVTTPNQDTLIGMRRNKEGLANEATSLVAEKMYPIITKYYDEKKMVYSFNQYMPEIIIEETPYPNFHNKMPIDFDRVTTPALEFWGVGFAEPVLTLAHEVNSIRNMRRDNENLTTNAMLEAKLGDVDDEEDELVVRPGAVFHSESGQGLRFLQPPTMADSYQAETTAKADIDRTTGLSGPIMGESSGDVTAASGISLMQKAQLLRLRRALKNECACYKSVISKILANNCQFLPLPEVFAVLGAERFGDYTPLAVSSLSQNTVVIVEPAGIYEDDNILRQQMTNMANVISASPIFSPLVNPSALLKRLLEVNGFPNPDDILNKPGGINVMESMFAAEENIHMAQGIQIPPATMEDDYDIHMAMHNPLNTLRPDLWQIVGPHMYSHDMLKAQQIQQQTAIQTQATAGPGGGNVGQQGPGSKPPGGQGGVNPARQPQPTGQLGLQRSQARLTPGKRG